MYKAIANKSGLNKKEVENNLIKKNSLELNQDCYKWLVNVNTAFCFLFPIS